MSHYTSLVKSAAAIDDAKDIMNSVYSENPKHWPNGLTAEHFDGGLYLVRKSASHEPVGFVGWQERNESNGKVGYYSVGIKPEYRRHGFAKEAVTKLIAEKSASVDIVRALVDSTNKPSMNLASKLSGLGIETKVTKSATHDDGAGLSWEEKHQASLEKNIMPKLLQMLETYGASGVGQGTARPEDLQRLLGEKYKVTSLPDGGGSNISLADIEEFRNHPFQAYARDLKELPPADILNHWEHLNDEQYHPKGNPLTRSYDDLISDEEVDIGDDLTNKVLDWKRSQVKKASVKQAGKLSALWDIISRAGKSPAGSNIIGGGLGTGTAAVENELILDDAPSALKHLNLALGALTGGSASNKLRQQSGILDPAKRKGLFQILNDSGITYKQLGLYGANKMHGLSKDVGGLSNQITEYAADASDRVATELEGAKANLEAEKVRLSGNMWKDIKDYAKENPWKTGLVGGGVGASVLGAYLYNALKKPNKAKPGVMTVEIPEGEVRDRFYTNLSRNMLFNDKGKDKKKKKTLALPNK